MVFGERLNQARKEHGKTAQDMADMLGIGIRSYRAYESGDREHTSLTWLRLLTIWMCLPTICCVEMNFS